ncbi:hypothetical protein AAFF_G00063040 [Aldrovandia affinis]|uniref:PH domain-containing protein n=1 Tax=Aldrovandia affinis TaxID=143900 RepID=A0AAD7RZT3_9TELE|nr:hypothetical protein AAFF_G00063040 [Aldrovandia affinis]
MDLQLRRLSGISSLHEEVGQEWDKLVAVLDSERPLDSQWPDPCQVKGQDPEFSAPSVARVCSSVHTRIQHLNGHEYHPPVKKQSPRPQPACGPRVPPHPSPESPGTPRRTADKVASLERRHATPASVKPGTSAVVADAVHPDHQQFEEEEEELEDIWNQTNGYRQSVCSDIMYQTYQGELASTPPGQPREPHPQDSARLYRKLVTASAPDLLAAELHPPTSDHAPLDPGREPSLRQGGHAAKPDRKSWAAFPPRAPASRQITLVNETAADPVKLPDIQDQEKYIYQYREEEEEEQEGVEAELGVEADTGCPKAQSMSLLSVHMGLEEASRRPMGLGMPHSDREEQGQNTSAKGHCSTTGRRLELQSMEGILERKHRLQLGGKKAPCRAWSTSHAVLFRQTLCFYQDRKDTLKSSVSGLPLNLIGAECSPAPEYNKKNNCFSLRLCDGSEYLLSASSRFLMKKWMLKIQTNTGLSESDPYRCLSGPCVPEDLPLTTAACHCGTKCHCPSRVKSTPSLSASSHIGTVKGKEIVVLTRDDSQIPRWQHGNLEDLSAPLSSDAGHCEDYYSSLRQAMKQRLTQRPKTVYPSLSNSPEHPSSKRRSQSFTSATYQKITPVSLAPAAHGGGSSYSVTLVIGDHLSETTPASNSSERPRPTGWGRESFPDPPPERSYASLPRPQNKSVFRKFFGKKEWTHDL